jgi:4-amino-4-deoxy-L-arabinose transferase-like glycosyltransferase
MTLHPPPPLSRTPSIADRVSRRTWLWLGLAMLCLWFLPLDARHLLRSDEGRYAEIAREMFASGDWVTIRYQGLKYFEKPPFHLWMTAIAFHAFGIGEWQARLWVAMSGVIGLAVTAWAAHRWYGRRVAMLTALALLAMPTWNLAGHFNALDMGVAAALACVLAGVLIAQHPAADASARRRWMLFAWAAMAVATLTKGLIGIVLPGLVLVVYTLAARDWLLWRRLHLIAGTLLFLMIAAPWFVLVSMRNPEFANFFFIHEHWQRYTSTVHHRSAPVWYFVPQLLAGALPWLGLVGGMARAVATEKSAGDFRPALLLVCWAASIFVFFSASGSKLPGYIVPIFPALAVLVALALDRLDAAAWRRQVIWMLIAAVVAMCASPLITRVGAGGPSNALYRDYAVWVGAACVVAVIGFGVALRLAREGPSLRSTGTAALGFFAAATIALTGHETIGRSASGVDLVAPIERVLTPAMPIYAVRLLDHTLPFYLRRTMVMVEEPDELEFGTQQEPQKWLPTLAAFLEVWSTGPKALAVMGHDTHAELQGRRVIMNVVAQDARRVVVANFSLPAP